MSGTVIGGKKAAQTNRRLYGSDFYDKLGISGGKAGRGYLKGFASEKRGKDGLTGPERAARVGVIGGTTSRRTSRALLVEPRRRSLVNWLKGLFPGEN